MSAAAQPKRRRQTPDGSTPLLRRWNISARDERAVCEAEQAWSKGGTGPTDNLWSAASRALVTAERFVCLLARHDTKS